MLAKTDHMSSTTCTLAITRFVEKVLRGEGSEIPLPYGASSLCPQVTQHKIVHAAWLLLSLLEKFGLPILWILWCSLHEIVAKLLANAGWMNSSPDN
jgi:hypothetical protein